MKKTLAGLALLTLALSFPFTAKAETYVDNERGEMTQQVPDSNGAISSIEQKLLDELNKGAVISGKTVYFNASEITATQNYLKRVDLSQAQVDKAVASIQAARTLFEAQSTTSTSGNIHDIVRELPVGVANQLAAYVTEAGKSVGLTVTWSKGVATFTIADKNGNVVYQNGSAVKTTGVDASVSVAVVAVLFAGSVIGFVVNKKAGREDLLIAE